MAAREPNSTHHTTTTDTTVIQYDSSTPASQGGDETIALGKPQPHNRAQNHARSILRRKEVIQPHLPVRLPCYDLVPITSLTLDGSPHEGRATGFGCYPLS